MYVGNGGKWWEMVGNHADQTHFGFQPDMFCHNLDDRNSKRTSRWNIRFLNVAVDFLREHIETLHVCFPQGLNVAACPCLNYWHAIDLNVLGIPAIVWMKKVRISVHVALKVAIPGSHSQISWILLAIPPRSPGSPHTNIFIGVPKRRPKMVGFC